MLISYFEDKYHLNTSQIKLIFQSFLNVTTD